ncbi:MAG: tetratricopeptide repeat protein [Verrucomicrobia bacterium]|nr:tetratricopeptide repeat protein [Verrucomicrobiota bacterium]
MDETSPSPRPFNVRLLPWIVGAGFLILYCLTLHPWMGPSNVPLMGQLFGWEADPPYTEPLLYLIGLLLRWLPAERLPFLMNLLAAVLGAVNVAILARCVALLPHDRMREQRIRGHADDTLLHGWFSPLPVIFAAGLLGLQLTFWENATLQTGEMLDLLMFSFCVLALLEYRQDLKEGWLWAASFVWGAGISTNWAMIGFAPLFLTAIIWIRGWSFFNAAFLTRMIVWGVSGLGLYLVIPLLGLLSDVPGLGFWGALKTNLIIEKTYLFSVPRGRPLLLALVLVLPLALVGIRWQGSKGTTVERYATFSGIILLQVLWLVGVSYLAFDPPFSARRMVYLEETSGGLPLLTFSFCGALAAGYLSGWFLLIGFTNPSKTWDQSGSLFTMLGKGAAAIVLVATVAVPVGLMVRNWPVIRAGNTADSLILSRALLESLPATPSVVLSDNPYLLRLARAAALTRPGTPAHFFFETQRGPDPRYREWVVQRTKSTIPEFAALGGVTENIAGVTTDVVTQLAGEGRAFYLHPSFGFFFERVRLQPAGVIYSLTPQPSMMVSLQGTPEQSAAALRSWQALSPALDGVARARLVGAKDGKRMSEMWSRAANSLGVELQRQGRLPEAGQLFAQSQKLSPENKAALVNAAVNADLQAGRVLSTELNKPVANSVTIQVLNTDGPLDEPVSLRNIGQSLLSAVERLPRQAWDAFRRAEQLAPTETMARFGQIEALLQAGMYPQARTALNEVKQSPAAQTPSREFVAALQRLEIYYALTQGDIAGAERLIADARTQFASDTSLLDLLTELYIRQGRYDEAMPLLEQWRKQRPEDPPATLRLAAIYITRAQFETALRLLDQLLVLQPDNPGARLNKAISLLQLNRLDDAKREYQLVAERIPDLPMIQFGLAEISLRRKNTNDALEHLEKYLKNAPTNTVEYSNVVERVSQMRSAGR